MIEPKYFIFFSYYESAQLFVSLRHFGHFSHSRIIKPDVTVFISLYFRASRLN